MLLLNIKNSPAEYLSIRTSVYNQCPWFINRLGLFVNHFFLYVKNEMSYDQFFPNDHKLFFVQEKAGEQDYGAFTVPYKIAPILFNDFSGVKAYSRFINHSNHYSIYLSYKPENGGIKSFYESGDEKPCGGSDGLEL